MHIKVRTNLSRVRRFFMSSMCSSTAWSWWLTLMISLMLDVLSKYAIHSMIDTHDRAISSMRNAFDLTRYSFADSSRWYDCIMIMNSEHSLQKCRVNCYWWIQITMMFFYSKTSIRDFVSKFDLFECNLWYSFITSTTLLNSFLST